MYKGLPTAYNKPLFKVLALLALIVFAFWVASFFPDLVLTLILSFLLAFVLKPLVRILEFKFNVHRKLAIVMVFLFIGAIITFVLVETVPILLKRTEAMYEKINKFPFEEKLTAIAEDVASNIPFVNKTIIGQHVRSALHNILQYISGFFSTIASYLINIIIIPFIAYFILADGDLAIKKLVERIPNKYFEMTLNVIYKLQRELVSYVKGLILECSIVGGLYVIGFMVVGVPYAVFLGIVTGVVNLVPYIGPIAGAGFAVIISLMQFGDFRHLLPIIILYVIIRLIDDLVLQPYCFGKTLDMHPVAVVLTLIIGYQLMGIAGMVIAIPIATILRVSSRETYWGFKNYSITV